MEYRAIQKYVKVTPRKLRWVVPMAKDLTPSDAVERLPYLGKRAAEPLAKTIRSAVANAESQGVKAEDLVFSEIQIMEGPKVMRRGKAGGRGRWYPVVKRMSHIKVVLKTKPEVVKPKLAGSRKVSTGRVKKGIKK